MQVDRTELSSADFLDQISFENISLKYRYLHLFPKNNFYPVDQTEVLKVLGSLQCLLLSELKEVSINSSHKCRNLFSELSISYQVIHV